ncbi:MAG TPA: tRNA pseudouridine(38-40) synthase TruA [Methylococcaceae bacterium]|nr:tRNA pseudouridine(38-40) synthase TruA [Methylococcaceae bacterium]HIA45291.1 tRNA pseudouridine(38-40) synthase TruA [Methylococcaceae bacterium]HIN68072.1 tRNA pseudouridine(38-40) synthase TruA [Methylococcales bacterium]
MNRLVMGVEYNGSQFSGWQWQRGLRTVQSVLETALATVANEPVTVVCAGRTDSGVHALEQVVHMDTTVIRSQQSWLMGANTYLPDDVRLLWVQDAQGGFHARYSAIARFYRYVILNRPIQSALRYRQVTWCYPELNVARMHEAAQYLVGNHDFTSFRAQGCQSKSPRRFMYFIKVYQEGDLITIDLCANAFVHHMVRNIAGTLIEIGQGKHAAAWCEQLLNKKDRRLAPATAAPHGLYLGGIFYPPEYGVVNHPVFAALPVNAARFD